MAEGSGSQGVIADEYSRACCRSNAFNFYASRTVQLLYFYSFYGSLFVWQLSPK